jgi:hypothetical protein
MAASYLSDFFGSAEEEAEARRKADKARFEAEMQEYKAKLEVLQSNNDVEQNGYQRAIDLAAAEGKETKELEKAKIRASINYQKEKSKELWFQAQSLRAMYDEKKLLGMVSGDYTEFNAVVEQLNTAKASMIEANESIKDSENQLKIIEINNAKESADKQKEIRDKNKEGYISALEEIKAAN